MLEEQELRGRVLAGRYQLESRLGHGGMGSIWRAHHLVLAAPVAVKLIERQVSPEDELSTRFMREAQAAAALRSPHVVQIIDYGIDGNLPFIVMELLEGETLAQRIKRATRLNSAETARIMAHVARAVGRAHEASIIHRDLKPENVFLVHNEDEEIAKVLDFGVAKIAHAAIGPDGSHTRTGSIMGTPYYMSPEQAQGNKAVDYRSDLWSLGVIAFECMTGQRPFYSEGLGDLVLQICIRDLPVPSQYAPVPAAFDAWFAKAVARDPEQRFQSAKELSDALREALGIEVRETQTTFPDVSGTGPHPAQKPETTTRRGLGASTPGPHRLQDADGNAATIALVPQELPARSMRIGDHIVPTDEHSPNGMRVIFGVAATALIAGLVLGFMFLRSRTQSEALELPAPIESAQPVERVPARVPPSAAVVPEPPPEVEAEASEEESATKATKAVVDAGVSDAARTEESSASDASVRAAASADAAAPKARSSAEPAPAPTPASPDGGWVKPDWAIPDEEPVRRPEPESLPESEE